MTASKGISKYFENIEAGRGPPKSKKRKLFPSAIIDAHAKSIGAKEKSVNPGGIR